MGLNAGTVHSLASLRGRFGGAVDNENCLLYCGKEKPWKGWSTIGLGALIQPVVWNKVMANAALGQRGLNEPCHQQNLGHHLGVFPLENKDGGCPKPAGRIFWFHQKRDERIPMPCS